MELFACGSLIAVGDGGFRTLRNGKKFLEGEGRAIEGIRAP